MKLSPVGIMVVTLGALVGIIVWVVAYIGLPNDITHRNLAKNPAIQTSVNQTASGNATPTSASGTSGTAIPTQIVEIPQKPASQIHLVDTSDPGYQIFEQTCAACHGSSAEGKVGPPIYAIGHYWSESQILGFVQKGMGGMPPNGGLSDPNQVKEVVAWLSKQKG
ncbi:c-type cytochrome [Alicyclobacillus cycloheptanicus]|uniref:Mono/diheme cytochrome c family protein n=1 Tax=Alicyclobacillus cycloheptanicus TaxID=1457 RepID=A0ABT9XL42_9BACL|nr:c-type cytochrome [Alicyclobacillus cycloheptanicus]MDQ0191008.1 mono/diheme cytochrome c family protein [Alicyclobacillus cycloheptanicus]WDM00901.1 c-type cytochrome [Alicyclobacillus cycloheptanicus]